MEGADDVVLRGQMWRRLMRAMSAETTRIACWIVDGGIGMLLVAIGNDGEEVE